MTLAQSYNDRLFRAGTLRALYHEQRFRWLASTLRRLRLQPSRVIELGCFDGRVLDWLPQTPVRYIGFDAGWEGGLEHAQSTRATPSIEFVRSIDPDDLGKLTDHSFDVAVSLETLEHIPPALVDAYIDELARLTSGYLLVTVPNEKGVPLLARQVMKAALSWNDSSDAERYTAKELYYGVLGKMERVERREHKGFNYSALVKQIARRFEIVSVEGLPSRWIPAALSFSVAIVARSKPSEP